MQRRSKQNIKADRSKLSPHRLRSEAKNRRLDRLVYRLFGLFTILFAINFGFRKGIDASGPWIYIVEGIVFILFFFLLRRYMKSEFKGQRVLVALILIVVFDAVFIAIPCQRIIHSAKGCDRREYFQITFHNGRGQYRVSDGMREQWMYLPNDGSIPSGAVEGWRVECCFIDCYFGISALSEVKFLGR